MLNESENVKKLEAKNAVFQAEMKIAVGSCCSNDITSQLPVMLKISFITLCVTQELLYIAVVQIVNVNQKQINLFVNCLSKRD